MLEHMDEAIEYIDNLVMHGKTISEAVAHAWHRFGIESRVLMAELHRRGKLRAPE